MKSHRQFGVVLLAFALMTAAVAFRADPPADPSAALTTLPATSAPDGPKYWKGNLHTHSLWSDGDDFPEMIADWYKRSGYHFLCLTEHNLMADGGDLFFPLEPHPRLDHVFGKHPALKQELVVGFEGRQRLVERGRSAGHVLQFFGRQVVDVLVERFTRIGLLTHPVEHGHEDRGEREVRIGRSVG